MAEETTDETTEETPEETAGATGAAAEDAEAAEADAAVRDAEEEELGVPADEISVDVGMRAAETRGQHRRKVRVGVVTRAVQDKTVTVEVQRQFAHPLYGKQVGRSKSYHAHDEDNRCNTGDIVRIVETRPISKTKRWRIAERIEQAE